MVEARPTAYRPARRRPCAADLMDANPHTDAYRPKEEDRMDLDPPPANRDVPNPNLANENEANEPQDEEEPNLNPTCVTPLIAHLAAAYYSDLDVTDSKKVKKVDHFEGGIAERDIPKKKLYRQFLQNLLDVHHSHAPRPEYQDTDAIPVSVARPMGSGHKIERHKYYSKVTLKGRPIRVSVGVLDDLCLVN